MQKNHNMGYDLQFIAKFAAIKICKSWQLKFEK